MGITFIETGKPGEAYCLNAKLEHGLVEYQHGWRLPVDTWLCRGIKARAIAWEDVIEYS